MQRSDISTDDIAQGNTLSPTTQSLGSGSGRGCAGAGDARPHHRHHAAQRRSFEHVRLEGGLILAAVSDCIFLAYAEPLSTLSSLTSFLIKHLPLLEACRKNFCLRCRLAPCM